MQPERCSYLACRNTDRRTDDSISIYFASCHYTYSSSSFFILLPAITHTAAACYFPLFPHKCFLIFPSQLLPHSDVFFSLYILPIPFLFFRLSFFFVFFCLSSFLCLVLIKFFFCVSISLTLFYYRPLFLSYTKK